MSPFYYAEKKGRDLFKEILNQANITDYEFTQDRFNSADGFYRLHDKQTVFEIKVRDPKYCTCQELIIEDYKYQMLKQIKSETNSDSALYINFIGDTVYIFPLSIVASCPVCELACNHTTAIKTEKKVKKVRYLNKNKAVAYKKVNGVWKRIPKNL